MDIISPADSVFSHQDSDENKTTPSPPVGITQLVIQAEVTPEETTPPEGVTPEDEKNNKNAEHREQVGGEERTLQQQEEKIDCHSPQNTMKISAFHKSLSDLAHTFSSILISEDEENVLNSAE